MIDAPSTSRTESKGQKWQLQCEQAADGMVRFSSYLPSVARTAAEPLLELGGSARVLRVEQEGPHPVGNGVENTEYLNK